MVTICCDSFVAYFLAVSRSFTASACQNALVTSSGVSPVLQPVSKSNKQKIPVKTGIGLRAPHYREMVNNHPDVGWLEVHSENFFGPGGHPLHVLELLRPHYPLSLHGVGLFPGSTQPPDKEHLKKTRYILVSWLV